ncbi:MAG: translation elongation factor Ts [Candidatus Hydrogenedentota bacterium]
MITPAMVKKLREKTGAGMMDCKNALGEANGDIEKATEILRKKGLMDVAKRAGRITKQGIIEAYIHSNRKMGVLIEMDCETDFVARTDEFRALAHNLAMQVAATNPLYISRENIEEEVLQKEREIYKEQLKNSNKPEKVIEKIIEGKMEKFYQDMVLLEGQYIKDENKKVKDIVASVASKLGENIVVKRFVRFAIGE